MRSAQIELEISKKSSNKTNDINDLAALYKELAFEFYHNDQFDQALDAYQKAIQYYKNLKDKSAEYSECLHNIGNIYYFLGQYEESIENYKAAMDIRILLDDKRGIATSLNNIANIYNRIREYTTALDYYNRSISFKEDVNDTKGIASSLKNIATIQYFQSDYVLALESNLKALKLSEALNDSMGISFVYNNMGLIYNKLEKYKDALNFFEKSMQLKELLNDERGISITLHNIANINEINGDFDLAIANLNKSLSISEKNSDKEGISSTLNSLGQVYRRQGDLDKALKNFYASIEIDLEIDDKRGFLLNKSNLAEIFFDIKDFKQAKITALESILLAKELGAKEEIRNGHLLLSKILEKENKFQEALQNYQIYTAYADSLNNQELESKTARLEAEYEYDKQIALLKAEQKTLDLEKEKELQAQKFQRNILIIYTLFILFVAFILYRSYQKQRRDKEKSERRSLELEEANQVKAKIFSIIGHDLRGPINSLHQLLELYQNDYMDEKEFREVLPQLYKNVGGIMLVLDNLLKWSLVEMKMIQSNPKEFELSKSIRTLHDFFSSLIDMKEIDFISNIEKEVYVFADADQIQVILRNLIGNAIKYSKKGGKITLTSQVDKTHTTINIKDEGVGMPKAIVNTLFKDILVESKTGTTGEKGTGLGLSLSKYYAEMNGGEIWVESEEGKGSTFSFSIPSGSLSKSISQQNSSTLKV
ncbi:tetratricopeptide repeat protein,histidine kinase [Belliella baltica DSM 15883]|uniref:histidine kinase n=1 Tax=Belliella baltica (strain DSM 15883 / CIP 108006 / LMG 21964 / BA134) TaxID=866536 RepID=I3Z8Y3_BELBD|nr:tetratricopeptide repeat-containing sensor histidine kinase [Belliella baltica]AFL85701.1 tetratricopeptide repeat protein,histidine kinase [Belliella baltica DSM 15883]